MRHDSHFTVIGNHLAQHRRLSLLAIGLAVHIQSLPAGTRVAIRTLAERFPDSEHRIGRALRELEAQGYLARVCERLPSGRVVTRTISYNRPHGTPSSVPTRTAPSRLRPRLVPSPEPREAPRPPRPPAPPAPSAPTADAPDPQPPAAELPTQRPPAAESADTPPPAAEPPAPPRRPAEPGVPPPPQPAPEPPTAARSAPEPAPGAAQRPPRQTATAATPTPALPPEHVATAHEILTGLHRADPRLLLSERDVHRLTPGTVRWLERGAPPEAISLALSTGLPPDLRHPPSVIAHRLRELLPPQARPRPDLRGRGPRPDPFQDCDGCGRVFRSPTPGRCGDCRRADGRAAGGTRSGCGVRAEGAA
ncbi:helix-turn-helix domain-containing protein [Streptomyces sp. CS62]|uniref:helix-turn-helix domain-containing protein n=1 Tax=Streptomyces sp. CS62 TaxID=3119268 RepID=UPI002F938134